MTSIDHPIDHLPRANSHQSQESITAGPAQRSIAVLNHGRQPQQAKSRQPWGSTTESIAGVDTKGRSQESTTPRANYRTQHQGSIAGVNHSRQNGSQSRQARPKSITAVNHVNQGKAQQVTINIHPLQSSCTRKATNMKPISYPTQQSCPKSNHQHTVSKLPFMHQMRLQYMPSCQSSLSEAREYFTGASRGQPSYQPPSRGRGR